MWFKNKKNKRPKVKIVAVAKDEAAYLPEWVFHHMYMGFDAIDIYVNRTTDNTYSMVEAIGNIYPTVKAIDADWIDQCSSSQQQHMQSVIYQKAFNEIKHEAIFDYVLFIDIDEYWVNQNFNVTIQKAIEENSTADCIAFSWFNQFGEDQEFSTLSQSMTGKLHFLVKSLVKVSNNVKSIRLHRPALEKENTVLIDGTQFQPGEKGEESLEQGLIKKRSAMIVHRMFRSPMEYVSLLSRGRPSTPDSIKLNRGGYNECVGEDCRFSINEKDFEKYSKLKCKFLKNNIIAPQLVKSRAFVAERFQQTLSNVKMVSPEFYSDLIRVFTGCKNSEYDYVLCSIFESDYTQNTQDVDWLVKLANHVEKQNKSAALVLWQKAQKLRPNGPKILQKLKEYKRDNIVEYF